MKKSENSKRVESKAEINAFIARLVYVLKDDSTQINFQKSRRVDNDRREKYTNRYTIGKLFPDEDEIYVIKKILMELKIENYIETVKDTRFPKKSEMRVFGKKLEDEDVYMKIRVEVVEKNYIFVMSFHFAEINFLEDDFPYK